MQQRDCHLHLHQCQKAGSEKHMNNYNEITSQGWHQVFSNGGLTLSMRGLKYGFQGTINAKNIQKSLSPSDKGASMPQRMAIAPLALVPPVTST